VAIVDLDGPASVQPLDFDHDGTDDRILASVDTPGSAEGLSLALNRGLGFVADGPGGLAVLQLLPPRVRFTELLRDPVKPVSFEEQSIAANLTAYLTDDALRVTVEAIAPPREQLTLVIEGGQAGASPLVTLANGAAGAAIVSGSNTLELPVAHDAGASPQSIRIAVRTAGGAVIANRTVNFVVPDPGTAQLEAVRLGPLAAVLTDDAPIVQVGVAGFYDSGQIFNLTRAAGTAFSSDLSAVATVDNLGTVTALAGGVASITGSNSGVADSVQVRVDRPAVLTALQSPLSQLTFRSIGEQTAFPSSGCSRRTPGSRICAAARTDLRNNGRRRCERRHRWTDPRHRRGTRARHRYQWRAPGGNRGHRRSADAERDFGHHGRSRVGTALARHAAGICRSGDRGNRCARWPPRLDHGHAGYVHVDGLGSEPICAAPFDSGSTVPVSRERSPRRPRSSILRPARPAPTLKSSR
jgi:hypothetical protein